MIDSPHAEAARALAAPPDAGRAVWRTLSAAQQKRVALLALYAGVVSLLFLQPLWVLVSSALGNSLNSYIPLVPVIAAYLLYTQPGPRLSEYRTSATGAAVLVAAAAAALALRYLGRGALSPNDGVAVSMLAYVCLLAAGGFLFLGTRWMVSAAFPVAFLIFLVPLPDSAVYWFEHLLVLASAEASAAMFRLTGTPLLRDGTVLGLPGITLAVAQECSGIRSTWVLLITSLVASRMFLESPWRRLILVLFVIPLGIIRNGFRILVIGLLCVHIGPHMIDSFIHRQGGPIFFALSLGPLLLVLWWLRRGERARTTGGQPTRSA